MSQLLIGWVRDGGLIAIFALMGLESAGIPISSEIVVPLGGALSLSTLGNAGAPDYGWFVGVVLASTAGNLVGSLAAFGLTRRYGVQALLGPGRRVGLSEGHLRLAHRVFDRWGLLAVFGGRLIPVVRTYISFPAGLSDIRTLPFAMATVLGAIPWNLGLAYAGLRLGQHFELIEGRLFPLTVLSAAIVLLLAVGAYALGRRSQTS